MNNELREKFNAALGQDLAGLGPEQRETLFAFINSVRFYREMGLPRSLNYEKAIGAIDFLTRSGMVTETVSQRLYDLLRNAAGLRKSS